MVFEMTTNIPELFSKNETFDTHSNTLEDVTDRIRLPNTWKNVDGIDPVLACLCESFFAGTAGTNGSLDRLRHPSKTSGWNAVHV